MKMSRNVKRALKLLKRVESCDNSLRKFERYIKRILEFKQARIHRLNMHLYFLTDEEFNEFRVRSGYEFNEKEYKEE